MDAIKNTKTTISMVASGLRILNAHVSVAFCLILILLVSSCATVKRTEVLGKDRLFAFLYLPKGTDPNTLKAANFIHSKPEEWKYWKNRGVIPSRGKTWFNLLNNPVDKAVEILTTLDYGGNPNPVVVIDEFGFDFGGQMDQKAAELLRKTKEKMPNLSLVVWQMRGPIAPVLADAYRDVVDLILPEAYVGGEKDYWRIITQVRAAQLQGLMHKTIIGLGLGIGGYPGENWVEIKKELEQQVRFLRLIAPESPGVAFFAGGANRGEPGLIEFADELCGKFDQIPTDGAGLPESLLALHKTFTIPRTKPTLVVSSRWVEPNRSWEDPDKLVQPITMRMLLMNLGAEVAEDILIQLRNPKEMGGDVFALGTVTVPGKSVAVASLPVIAKWRVWKTWEVEVEAMECEVMRLP